jgi:hypothetical protein
MNMMMLLYFSIINCLLTLVSTYGGVEPTSMIKIEASKSQHKIADPHQSITESSASDSIIIWQSCSLKIPFSSTNAHASH